MRASSPLWIALTLGPLVAHSARGPFQLRGLEPCIQAAVQSTGSHEPIDDTNTLAMRVFGPVWGGLLPAQYYGVGINPSSVAISDLNLDGIPDLAVADLDLPTRVGGVSVLLGAGDGTFAAAQGSAAGDSPMSVASSDLNLDGVPDLAVANFFSSDVSVLLGTGDGSFDLAVSYAAGPQPLAVAVADLNLDGVPDIAAANDYHGTLFGNEGYVAVLLGVGDGTFSAFKNYGAGDEPASLAISDLNRDGIPDLAVANHASDDVSVLFGAGDGSFALDQSYGVGNHPEAVAISDLNQDGVPDLAVVATFPSNAVSVLLGTGDGSFSAAESYAAGASPRFLAIADLDLDGSPDLAVANLGSNDVSVHLNQLPE